jgi:signal transduction histidine kinase
MTRRRCWLTALGVVLVAWIVGAEWVSIHAGVPENHFIDAAVGLSFVLAGLVALDRRPGNATGVLMIAYAVSAYFGNWSNLNIAAVPMIGMIGAQPSGAFIAHAALAYPTGRLRTRFERFVIGLIYGVNVVVCVVILLAFDPRADGCTRCAWEPAPFPSRTAVLTSLSLSQRAAFLTVPLFFLAVWLRWRRSTPAERRDLIPLWIGFAVVGLVYLMDGFASPDTTADQFSYLMWELQSVLQISLPLIFLWGLLATRLARSAVGDLVVAMDRPLLPGELRAALAKALGDPLLRVLYALDDGDHWVDADGRPESPPRPGEGRRAKAVTVIDRAGGPLAALIHDPALDAGLVRAVAAAAGIRLENERLQADLRAQLDEVRASRQRIVEAGDRERRRVERNLHDGAQQRLATLVLSLAMLRDRDGVDPALAASIEATTSDLKQAIAELRELARGIHPAILTEEGLPAAVEALADRSAVPVQVRTDFEGRLSEPVEAVAYFVVAESIANVIKYAQARAARVELSRRDGVLLVEVSDDGVGGADVSHGSGLRGLADRVAAVRGTFGVQSPPGGGTRVRVEIPVPAER